MRQKLNLWQYRTFFIVALLLTLVSYVSAQSLSAETRLQSGINYYSRGRFREAVQELIRAHDDTSAKEIKAEALFWKSLSELSLGEYNEALRDMDALQQTDPASNRVRELPYHRGRVLFYLGRYNEAVVLLKNYADSIRPAPGGTLNPQDASWKASALYWTGESLYSMGQLERAEQIFRIVTEEYPESPKYEASVYRLALIDQKKVENELLGLLKWSHEESLRNTEEFRRKETSYDQALSAYQRRLSDGSGSSGLYDETRVMALEEENAQYREKLGAAEDKIRSMETSLGRTNSITDTVERLKSLKASALELEGRILRSAP